jgi:hypothetical protein
LALQRKTPLPAIKEWYKLTLDGKANSSPLGMWRFTVTLGLVARLAPDNSLFDALWSIIIV